MEAGSDRRGGPGSGGRVQAVEVRMRKWAREFRQSGECAVAPRRVCVAVAGGKGTESSNVSPSALLNLVVKVLQNKDESGCKERRLSQQLRRSVGFVTRF